MEDELALKAAVICRGSSRAGDESFDMNVCTTGAPVTAQLSILTSPEMQQIYSQWIEFKRLLQLPAIDNSTAALAPGALDGLSWEGTVPVAARNLALSVSNSSEPAEFAITELRGISQAGLDHFVLATSSNGKPLYGAYVRSSQGEPCLQQLFEFSQTAFDAGVFLPVPTVGAHYQGDYGLDYARHRFYGSIASLPELLRLPASPTSGFLHPSPGARRALLEVPLEHAATAITSAPSTHDEVHDSMDSLMSPLPTPPSPGETPNPGAFSNFVAPSYNDCVSSYQETQEEVLDALPNSPAPISLTSSCTGEGGSPLKIADEPPQPQVQQTLNTPPSASSASEQRVPDRCQPCSLCVTCKKFWGIDGLPRRHFETGVFRAPEEETPAILCSEKTAARKRKWTQCRHGPKSKTSEYRGVNLYKRTWKWEAHIWHNGEQLYLGASITKAHAAQVYDRAALFLFGSDAEINFKPEGYQQEYEFMQRLSYGQMVVYLRRESRQNGEEVRYPGVAKVKSNLFSASYRPRKEKDSHEHIGFFKTEEEALRAVLKEAKRRRNYEMAAKILDVHHLRSVRPAAGKIKQKRRSRAACIVESLKVAGSKPSTRASKRAQRAAAKSTSAIRTQALPILEVAIASPTRQGAKMTVKSEASGAAKDSTATVPVSMATPRRQKPESVPPNPTRTYFRKSLKAREKSALKEEVIEPASVAVAVEAPPSQKTRVAGKRKNSYKSKSSSGVKKRGRGRDPLTRFLGEDMTEGESSGSPAPLRRNRPRRCNYTKSAPIASRQPVIASRQPGIASTPVLPDVVPQPMTVASPPSTPPAQFPTSSTSPVLAIPLPLAPHFISVGMSSGSKTGSDETGTHAYSADREGDSSGTPESQESGYASSSCLSFQSVGPTSKLGELIPSQGTTVEQAKQEATRQFQEACDWLVLQRRNLRALENPRLSESKSPKSAGVIRPVARRLSLTNWLLQPGEPGSAASGAVQVSANLVSPGRAGGGQLYIDLFGE